MSSTVLITGATSGLGRHAALYLAARGYHVIATGRRVEALESLRIEPGGNAIDVLPLDVSDPESIRQAVDSVERLTEGRGIGVLVNNAGYGQYGPLELVTDGTLRTQFETNVFGLLAVTRAFIPQIRAGGGGRIINVGSQGGRITFPFSGAYHATKYAVEALNDALRMELSLFGIDVVLIEPGPIRTQFSTRAYESLDALEGVQGTAYEPLFERAARIKEQADRVSAPPIVVSRAIHKAITRRRPKPRYMVPFSARMVVLILGHLLPTRWTDALMLRFLGAHRARALPHAGEPAQ